MFILIATDFRLITVSFKFHSDLLNLIAMDELGLILFLIAHIVRSSVVSLCSKVEAAGTWKERRC